MYIEVIHNSKSVASESFRTLRSNIQFSNFGKNIKIRHTPEIIFKIDDSLLKGMYMDELIKKVNNGYKDSSEENEKDGE